MGCTGTKVTNQNPETSPLPEHKSPHASPKSPKRSPQRDRKNRTKSVKLIDDNYNRWSRNTSRRPKTVAYGGSENKNRTHVSRYITETQDRMQRVYLSQPANMALIKHHCSPTTRLKQTKREGPPDYTETVSIQDSITSARTLSKRLNSHRINDDQSQNNHKNMDIVEQNGHVKGKSPRDGDKDDKISNTHRGKGNRITPREDESDNTSRQNTNREKRSQDTQSNSTPRETPSDNNIVKTSPCPNNESKNTDKNFNQANGKSYHSHAASVQNGKSHNNHTLTSGHHHLLTASMVSGKTGTASVNDVAFSTSESHEHFASRNNPYSMPFVPRLDLVTERQRSLTRREIKMCSLKQKYSHSNDVIMQRQKQLVKERIAKLERDGIIKNKKNNKSRKINSVSGSRSDVNSISNGDGVSHGSGK